MLMRRSSMLVAVLAIATTVSGAATFSSRSSGDRWLHVRVEDRGGRGEKVKINLPLSMLEKIAGAIDFEKIDGAHFRGGRLLIDDAGIDKVDLRSMWDAVKETDDMEFVSVESANEDVRVAKEGGYLLVRVRSNRDEDEDADDDRRSGEKVDVKVPLAVVDALLSAGERELDLRAALQALAEHGDGELVVVQDGSSSVRIWIDDKNTID